MILLLNRINGRKTYKLYYYSVNESLLSSVITAFNLRNKEPFKSGYLPNYGEDIIIELWKEINLMNPTASTVYVRMYYDGMVCVKRERERERDLK